MLNSFDWLRRCASGAELLATLELFEKDPGLLPADESLGPPHSALNGPCQRCWIYARDESPAKKSNKKVEPYCYFCRLVQARARKLGSLSRKSIVVWGFVNQLPRQLQRGESFKDSNISGAYAADEQRFLITMHRLQLEPWLRELVIYHGADLRGLLQIFPTIGPGPETGMGDVLCRAISREANFAMDRLRVQFYAQPYEIMKFGRRREQGILNFEAPEFLNLLEMARVFREVLYPNQQEALYELLTMEGGGEAQFYWGRFLGELGQQAKDMLNAWRIRQWPKTQVKLLYELRDYVVFTPPD